MVCFKFHSNPYLSQMKTVLVKEFGQATFDEVKQHVRDTMQQMEQHHLMPAADGADQLDTSNLFDRPPGSYVQY